MRRPASTGWHRRSEPRPYRHRSVIDAGAPSPRCSRSAFWPTAWLDRRGAAAPTPNWHDPCPVPRCSSAGRLVPRVADLRADVAVRGGSSGGDPGHSCPAADVDCIDIDVICDRGARVRFARFGNAAADLVSRFDTGDGLAAGSFSHRRTARADRHGRRAIPGYRRLPLRLRDGIDHRSRAWALPPSPRGLLGAQWAGPVRLPVTEGRRIHQRCAGAREASEARSSGASSSATCSRPRHSRAPETASRIERRGYATFLLARTIPLENATDASVARAQVDATRTPLTADARTRRDRAG